MDISTLENKARWVRRQILEMVVRAGKGHIGGALSCVDILVALYYGGILQISPENWEQPDRNKFILSKGHACVALYPILADLGFFPKEELETFGKNGCRLGGHPDRKIPGIEVDSGSLGHGLGISAGMVLGSEKGEVVVLLGDGECCEGSVWEAANFAGQNTLNRLIAVVDYNRFSAMSQLHMSAEHFANIWHAFGWETKVINGHSFLDLLDWNFSSIRPKVIIAQTKKGKGISFMEEKVEWHHGVPTENQIQIAREELSWT